MDLIEIHKAFHPKAAEYTFLSSVHGTFTRVGHMLGHKASLSKFKKIVILSSIFSDHNTMRLETNYKKKNCKEHKHVEVKHIVVSNQWITEEIKEEIRKYT